jgi:cytochrome c
MPRIPLMIAVTFGLLAMVGCREALDFDRTYTADPDRGARLYKANCANSCHPDNAFDQKSVKSFEQLAYTTREYYEQVMGQGAEYSQQDVFDIARYLNDKYYKFKVR